MAGWIGMMRRPSYTGRIAMSRKHYREIAKIMKECNYPEHWSFKTVINDLCAMFKRDNPNFKPEVFREACGL